MKILVIPDLHENLEFLKYIFAVEKTEDFDHIVMLGDYFDPHGDVETSDSKLQRVAGTLMGLKELHGDRLHLICGNHDLPYYALRPACGGRQGQVNPFISQWLRCTSLARAEIINELWDEDFWRSMEGAVLLDGWLFSHAGVHPNWWSKRRRSSQTRIAAFQAQWATAFDNIFEESENPIFSAGLARGGVALYGGPLWLDWNREFDDELEVPQIVGHTCFAKQAQKGRSYCIDMGQTAYAIVENGEVQLNIWPESWLGESMIDSV